MDLEGCGARWKVALTLTETWGRDHCGCTGGIEDVGHHMLQVAHSARRPVPFLLDIVRHDAIMFVDDVTLQAVTLAILNSTCSTDVGSLP